MLAQVLANFLYPTFHLTGDIAECFSLFDCLPLISFLFSARDTKAQFDDTTLIIHRKRYYCQTRFLFCGGEFCKLLFGEQ